MSNPLISPVGGPRATQFDDRVEQDLADSHLTAQEWQETAPLLPTEPVASPGMNRLAEAYVRGWVEEAVAKDVRVAIERYGYDPLPEGTPSSVDEQVRLTLGTNVSAPDVELEALAKAIGATDTRVAVADMASGFDLSHPVLRAHDPVGRAADVVDGDKDVSPAPNQQNGYHGTFTAALEARGTSRIDLVPIRVYGPDTTEVDPDLVVAAVKHAVKEGARVVNMSFDVHGQERVAKLRQLIVDNPAVLFVKSAGNDGEKLAPGPDEGDDYERFRFSPEQNLSANNLPNMMVVGATDRKGGVWSATNFSRDIVSVLCPGVQILSAMPGRLYGRSSGTSFSGPEAGNVAAKALLLDPTLTPPALMRIIESTVDRRPGLEQRVRSGGELNESKALRLVAYHVLRRRGAAARDAAFKVGMSTAEAADLLRDESAPS